MIRLINVSKYFVTPFGRHYVFRDVSLELPLDRNVGVIGPNGAGKSTFLRLLAGADHPSIGTIVKTGRISPPMGLTPVLQKSLTALENVRFAGRIYGMKKPEIERMIAYVRDIAKIGNYFEMPVETYSAGMRQKVAFGINMSMQFDYYLFDEISAGGDREFRKMAKAMVAERLRTSRFIMTSHDTRELLELCDAGIVIKDGVLTYFHDIRDAAIFYGDDVEEMGERTPRRRRGARKKYKTVDTAEAAGDEATPSTKTPRKRTRRAAIGARGLAGSVPALSLPSTDVGSGAMAAAPASSGVEGGAGATQESVGVQPRRRRLRHPAEITPVDPSGETDQSAARKQRKRIGPSASAKSRKNRASRKVEVNAASAAASISRQRQNDGEAVAITGESAETKRLRTRVRMSGPSLQAAFSAKKPKLRKAAAALTGNAPKVAGSPEELPALPQIAGSEPKRSRGT